MQSKLSQVELSPTSFCGCNCIICVPLVFPPWSEKWVTFWPYSADPFLKSAVHVLSRNDYYVFLCKLLICPGYLVLRYMWNQTWLAANYYLNLLLLSLLNQHACREKWDKLALMFQLMPWVWKQGFVLCRLWCVDTYCLWSITDVMTWKVSLVPPTSKIKYKPSSHLRQRFGWMQHSTTPMKHYLHWLQEKLLLLPYISSTYTRLV